MFRDARFKVLNETSYTLKFSHRPNKRGIDSKSDCNLSAPSNQLHTRTQYTYLTFPAILLALCADNVVH